MIDVNECALGIHECQQTCTNTLGSYECSCQAGYLLNGDQYTCSSNKKNATVTCTLKLWIISHADIDECAEGTAMCEQNCHDTVGSYTCSCSPGYTLNTVDGVRCHGEEQ